MREILFRGFHPCEDGDETVCVEGKSIKGRWVEGDLLHWHNTEENKEFCCCIPHEYGNGGEINILDLTVLPSTVGQYTGLTDKNGVKIFEGDILSTDIARLYLIVEYRNGAFMVNCNDGKNDYYDIFFSTTEEPQTVYKYGDVIGNIHKEGKL